MTLKMTLVAVVFTMPPPGTETVVFQDNCPADRLIYFFVAPVILCGVFSSYGRDGSFAVARGADIWPRRCATEFSRRVNACIHVFLGHRSTSTASSLAQRVKVEIPKGVRELLIASHHSKNAPADLFSKKH